MMRASIVISRSLILLIEKKKKREKREEAQLVYTNMAWPVSSLEKRNGWRKAKLLIGEASC